MARTKKQTLENASERKRLIQEEILRETLAAKQKKDNSTVTHSLSKNSALIASGVTTPQQSKAPSSGSLDLETNTEELTTKATNVHGGRPKIDVNSADDMSGQIQSPKDTPIVNKGDLPKAVICIPDICRSPVKSQDDDSCVHNSRDSSPRGKPTVLAMDSGAGEHRDGGNKKRRESPKQADKKFSTDVAESLKSLREASEKVREEKGKKSQQRSPSQIAKKGAANTQSSNVGRRSPRQQPPKTNQEPLSPEKRIRDSRSHSDEKPKVNIFTDHLGVELGKRIRSPRRLSEDMIALPIFSARRWSSSVKESTSTTYIAGKVFEDNPSSDDLDSSSASVNLSNDSFKSPNCSPSASKRLGTSESPQRASLSPSSYSPSQNKKLNSYESPQRSPLSPSSCSPSRNKQLNISESPQSASLSGSKSITIPSSLSTADGNHGSSRDNLLHTTVLSKHSELQTQVALQEEDKLSKCYPLRNTKCVTPKELPENRLFKKKKSDDTFIEFDNTRSETKVCGDHDTSPVCVKKIVKTVSSKAKKEKPQLQIDEEVEKLMSSICRDIVCDMVLPKNNNESVKNIGDALQNSVKTSVCDKPELSSAGKSYECESACERVKDVNADNSLLESVVDSKSLNADNESSSMDGCSDSGEDKPQSSLLCAMLVGGTEVANMYTLERERYKPQVVEISDSETDTSRAVSPVTSNSKPPTHNESVDCGSDLKSTVEESVKEPSEGTTARANEAANPGGGGGNCSGHGEKENSQVKHPEKIVKQDIQIKEEVHENDSDHTTDFKTRADGKTTEVDLLGNLKRLNENVLKLLEIDVEEEFLQDLEIEESHDSKFVCRQICETSLFDLITNLGNRLRNADPVLPNSIPVDIELVEKLIQSCPEITPKVIPRFRVNARMDKICTRLLEEEKKEASLLKRKVKLTENPAGELSVHDQKPVFSNTSNFNDAGKDTESSKAKELCGEVKFHKQKREVPVNCGDGNSACDTDNHNPNCSPHKIPLEATTACSSLNDSLCEMDVDAITSAVTKSVSLGVVSEGHTDNMCSENNSEHIHPSDLTTEALAKRTFQKSKTCEDFVEYPPASPLTHTGSLRRVNSSPQINAKLSNATSASPLLNSSKESQVRSKLGSKIPVPGTSYVSKLLKKTWRTPRIVKEPKPLAVLSELEESSSSAKNIFTCPNLQKYLNMPSNRTIVRPEQREEMNNLDVKAKEEEEKRETQKKEKEDSEKKSDEEMILEYKKYEPDFDEVDGMLFMSFSSEIELQAHVRVEKALEWDRDDTMLRVSRAKAFEEAKAHNGDMGEFKLKHLRGQHMRWKKYRRLYSNEVKALLEAKEKGLPITLVPKKTSDVSKIKGWKRKHDQIQGVNSDQSFTATDVSFEENIMDSSILGVKEETFFEEGVMGEDREKSDISPHSKRRQGFSHQKAHKQLFRELKMDWEDRMIHRKLGGWSLKGNRPRAFSRAAMKRQEKESKETDSVKVEPKDFNSESVSLEDLDTDVASDIKEHDEGPKRKKIMRMICPLLTEKMARHALKTLETGDVSRKMRKMKKKQRPCVGGNIPALLPIRKSDTGTSDGLSSPPTAVATVGSSTLTRLPSSPPPTSQPTSLLVSATTTPLALDLQEEPVTEGVDTAAEVIASPSIADTSSSRSCSKPGCRYGCICHLCSASEASAPLPSPVAKPHMPACEKEYCRLGCICDSLDPDKPISNPSHCGKSSCMLQCVCSESNSMDGNEDIPFLPSMKRRPKLGERFSNLPQREKTHRSAKNLDAITRKAMMLYETSEIYCEKVERVRKKPDTANSPMVTNLMSPTPISHVSTLPLVMLEPDIVCEPARADDDRLKADTSFHALNLSNSETTTVAASHLVSVESISSQHQHQTRSSVPKVMKPALVIDDHRHTVPIIEPSVHKRKRKSHPLSDEIFTSSTCARTQPYKYRIPGMSAGLSSISESQRETTSSVPDSAMASYELPTDSANRSPNKFDPIVLDDDSEQVLPKISSIESLATNTQELVHWENAENEGCGKKSEKSCCHGSTELTKKCSNMCSGQRKADVQDSSTSGNSKQCQGWHKSMVCLKAKATASQIPGEEDVQEEDEVKLLEFAANCNWEGAKKEILAKIAQCLTRGHYPQPRTMNVCEFVVEILPKAHQPSHIPSELRAKLPGQMYSIRVRVTRRESVSKAENDADIIDLSEPSPVKNTHSSIMNVQDSALGINLNTEQSAAETSDSSLSSSSLGISGLSKLYVNNSVLAGQANAGVPSSSQISNSAVLRNLNVPCRRRSAESVLNGKSLNTDHRHTADGASTLPASSSSGMKHKGSSFITLGDRFPAKTTASNLVHNNGTVVCSTSTAISKSKVSHNSLLKEAQKGKSSDSLSSSGTQSFPQVTPLIGPFNSKDLKYMKIGGKDGMMKIIEVATSADRDKKIIAVPLALSKVPVDLKGNKGPVPLVALSVSGTVSNRIVPILSSQSVSSQLKTPVSSSSPQQFVLRLPGKKQAGTHGPTVAGVKQPMMVKPIQGLQRYQLMPLSKESHVESNSTTPKVTASSSRTPNSNDEMIMVFDAAHIKASQFARDGASTSAQVSVKDKSDCSSSLGALSSSNPASQILTSVTASRDRPIMSAEISPSKLQNKLNGAIDLTADLVAGAAQTNSGEVSESNSMKDVDECDGCSNVSGCAETDLSDMLVNSSPTLGQPTTDATQISTANKDCEDRNVFSGALQSSAEPNLSRDSFENTSVSGLPECKIQVKSFCRSPPTSSEMFVTAGEVTPKTLYESVTKGSKRSHHSSTVDLEVHSPCPKKPCLSGEALSVNDEDSNVSIYSGLGVRTAEASPVNSVDRPKSVLSTAMSSGSSDDLLILLSSDDEIDVGEEPNYEEMVSQRVRAERALENDHGSMYIKAGVVFTTSGPTEKSFSVSGSKNTAEDMPEDECKSSPERLGKLMQKMQSIQESRIAHHNQLERLRRSKLRSLFDELQCQVMISRNESLEGRDFFMPKAKVLSEAKKVILGLCERVHRGDQLVKEYEKRNQILHQKLASIRANLLDKEVPAETINAVLEKAYKSASHKSRNQGKAETRTSTPLVDEIGLNTELEETTETVDLVSPSTEDDKASERQGVTTPVYEDISDPEDAVAPKYEDISDVDETKYEDISDSDGHQKG